MTQPKKEVKKKGLAIDRSYRGSRAKAFLRAAMLDLHYSPLTFFYGVSVLEKGFNPQSRVEAELIRTDATGALFRAQERSSLRSLFEQLLDVFEMSIEGRMLDRFSKEQRP